MDKLGDGPTDKFTEKSGKIHGCSSMIIVQSLRKIETVTKSDRFTERC